MSHAAIRLASRADHAAIYTLLQTAYATLSPSGVRFTVTRSNLAQVSARLAQHPTFVLERHGADGTPQLVGTVSLRFPWAPDADAHTVHPFLHWYAVDPACARQGLGKQLLDYVEYQFLRDSLSVPAVYLATAIHHPWLVGLYEARGYSAFKHSTNALGTELVWLRKTLLHATDEPLPATRTPAPHDQAQRRSA